MKRFRYIHLIWADEMKFSRPLVEMFRDNRNLLKSDEHAFVTPHRDICDALKPEGNVYLDESGENLFNKYAPLCSYVISHDFPSKKIVFGIRRRYRNRIVYRYWGGRRYMLSAKQKNILRRIYANIYNSLYKRAFRYIYDGLALIGISNLVDEIDLAPFIRRTPLMMMPYPDEKEYEMVQETKNKIRKSGPLRVLVGHKSTSLENHIYYLELLRKYPSDKLEIYVPLSYGDKKYRDEIVTYVSRNNLSNVTLVTDFMSSCDYISFLSTIDIAIIECANSIALGNIKILLSLGKTVYLSRNGVIRKACEREEIPTRCVDEISSMSFEKFGEVLEYEEKDSSLFLQSYDYYLDCWVRIMEFLD